ncbi:MAG: flagellar basal body rod protein FlgB [Helicobacteraceae bacterium]|nr:flagellar basal body rod protein FlgB [Helicobacteraceae bacterium]
MEISRAHDLMASALDYRSARQDIISSNIANADTPFYKARDISFSDMLANQRAETFRDRSNELPMAKTSASHLRSYDEKINDKAITFYRDGHAMGNDGNTVDIDVETTEMSKNNIMFNAVVMALKKEVTGYKDMLMSVSKP